MVEGGDYLLDLLIEFGEFRVDLCQFLCRADLQSGIIRAIGDARARFTEDGLRLLRAVRFAARMGFTIEVAGVEQLKRVKNIPVATPTFLYTWVEDAILLDHLWTPKADQLQQNQPDTVPVYGA